MFEHKNPISYEPAMNVFIYPHAFVCVFLICGTSLIFPSYVMLGLSKYSFLNSISLIPPLALIHIFEHKNPISYERAMNVLIYSCVVVCGFLICGTTLVFPSMLTPRLSKSRFKISSFRFHIINFSVRFDSHV